MNKYERDWSTHFRLSEESPSGLIRIKDRYGRIICSNAGTRCKEKDGGSRGWQLRLKNEHFYIHRIIWIMTYGNINPEKVVDHLDGNPLNNQISNLELKTPANNLRNKLKSINNSTGTTGVTVETVKGLKYYRAFWQDLDGKRQSKRFSIVKLGEETAKNSAIEYRKIQLQRLREEGAEYTERHGN